MATLGGSVATEFASKESPERRGSDSNVQETKPDHSRTNPLVAMDTSLEDGYNWRKYGQKHVKGSAFPRCYYKCKYPNCHVKKHFECSKDGQITYIAYKGKHDHPKTQSRHRMSFGSTTSVQQETLDRLSSYNNVKLEDKSSNSHGQTSQHKKPSDVPVFPSAATNDGNGVSENAAELERRADEVDYPESKRRKGKIEDIKVSTMDKPIREPRVVVQTPSEVDVLDDGYRWRKYGQKVVKGNPNPRSYYKCTNPRCPVRKHVERASNDRKAVITTYEGKHNHDVPSSAKITSNENEKVCPAVPISTSKVMLMKEGNDAISLDLSVGLTSTPADTTIHSQQDRGTIKNEKRKNLGY